VPDIWFPLLAAGVVGALLFVAFRWWFAPPVWLWILTCRWNRGSLRDVFDCAETWRFTSTTGGGREYLAARFSRCFERRHFGCACYRCHALL